MKVSQTSLPGVLLFEPQAFTDQRGFFFESYHEKRYFEAGLCKTFVQDNHSFSTYGTLRGLHYQLHHSQGKLVRVVVGEIFDVAIDIRRGSPTFSQWSGHYLSATNRRQIYIPEGFAHGFCVVSETAEVLYKCTDFYTPGDERGLLWNDPDIGIDWPINTPLLSLKDAALPLLQKLEVELPVYQEHSP